jgi:hypothetical protein
MTIYLVTLSNGARPEAFRSFAAAVHHARLVSPARYGVKAPDGDFYMYPSRSELYRDREGAAPHLVMAIVRKVRNPTAFLEDLDNPTTWRRAVEEVLS